MGDEGPKLFTNKPKKSKWKVSTPIPTVSSTPVGSAVHPPPPPPPSQKEPFFQRFRFPLPAFLERYKFIVPIVLVVNFTIGAYTLFRVSIRDKVKYDEELPDHPTGSTAPAPVPIPAITDKLVIQQAPVPEDQQRELFKWMLEEKRKLKPRDAEEKKRIDEEKAILKQFIQAKSLAM